MQWNRFRLKNPSVLDALAAVLSTCGVHETLSVTPRYFAPTTDSRVCPCNLTVGFLRNLLFVQIWITWHFSGGNASAIFFPTSVKHLGLLGARWNLSLSRSLCTNHLQVIGFLMTMVICKLVFQITEYMKVLIYTKDSL